MRTAGGWPGTGCHRAAGVAARGGRGDGGRARPGDVGGRGVAGAAGGRTRPGPTWPPRSGRSGRWSRRSGRAGPCTCCRPPTCRGGWRRSARCRSPAATPRASGCCPTRPTRSSRRSTRRCARRTAPPRSSTRTSPRRAARGRPRSRWRRSAGSGRGGGWRSVPRRCAGCSASGPTAAAGSPTPARAAGSRTSSLPEPDEAQLELLRAYLTAYGPATPAHLARWLATSPAWTTELFERADLEEVELEGEPAWVWARRHGVRRARAARRCGCCRTSTPSRSARSRAPCCSRAGRRSGRWRVPRPATTRCCCSTGWWVASGTRSGPAGGWRSRSSRWAG